MTLSSHKSSYKAQNYFAFSTAHIEKDNRDTFSTTSEPLDFEAFCYTMLNIYKDSLLFGDPLGPHILILYDRDNRTIHHECINFDEESERDVENLLPYILKIVSQMKPDYYYVSFNTYSIH
jgi:hypothetical protein